MGRVGVERAHFLGGVVNSAVARCCGSGRGCAGLEVDGAFAIGRDHRRLEGLVLDGGDVGVVVEFAENVGLIPQIYGRLEASLGVLFDCDAVEYREDVQDGFALV